MRFAKLFALSIFSTAAIAAPQTQDLPTKSNTAKTICGDEDNRVISEKPFAGRMLKTLSGTAPCSATLISNSCMVSAGHCSAYLKYVEFNTPISEDSSIVYAEPEDQYQVDWNSVVASAPTRMGNDWAVFKILPNTITNLLPGEAQGGFIEPNFDVPVLGSTIVISGYGTDTEDHTNFAQQTSFGELRSIGSASSKTLTYHSDTTGGNSGSGVIDEQTQTFIGVHTHGGCSRSNTSSNTGTSLAFSPKLIQAIQDCLASEK